MIKTQLTVFFEDPFWVGVCETSESEQLQASRIVFGAEPKDYEVYTYILQNWNRLKFSPPVQSGGNTAGKINPKRMQRMIVRQVAQKGVGTKAQQALKEQQEQNKTERKRNAKEKKEQEKERQFEIRQEKKKEKHKGH